VVTAYLFGLISHVEPVGEPNAEGIPVVTDHAGRGEPRVVFWKAI
jgi:hypothetical protein